VTARSALTIAGAVIVGAFVVGAVPYVTRIDLSSSRPSRSASRSEPFAPLWVGLEAAAKELARRFASRSCNEPVINHHGLPIALWPREASDQAPVARGPCTSPPGKIMVVSANLREAHPHSIDDIRGTGVGDLQDLTELDNFGVHLREHLRYAPDVLLLQEVIVPSARHLARVLEENLNAPYRVVIAGGDSNLMGPKGDDLKHKRNTAILINEQTTEAVGDVGYLTVRMRRGDEPPYEPRIAQDQAHALLRERATGLEVATMSIHWSTTYHFANRRVATRRRQAWADKVTAFMRRTFPRADVTVIAGEFNFPRCKAFKETKNCTETQLWKTMTSPPNGFIDAVYATIRDSRRAFRYQVTNRSAKQARIDFIFAKAAVYRASRSADYDADKYTPGFVSDHRYDFAVVGAETGWWGSAHSVGAEVIPDPVHRSFSWLSTICDVRSRGTHRRAEHNDAPS
jgi:exonuclease III